MVRPGFLVLVVSVWLGAAALVADAVSQVHYHEDGRPWKQRARKGPDAEVEGWYYNLGITGIRVELVAEAPKQLLVRHVFAGTPAYGKVRVGDHIVGVGVRRFTEEHKNGYGMKVFGADGPIREFALGLEVSQSKSGRGRLLLSLLRDGKLVEETLRVGKKYGVFAKGFPANCERSERILDELYDYLIEHQRSDGFWGNPVHNTFAPLALLSSGKKDHLRAVARCARKHAEVVKDRDRYSLINWRYMAAAIVLCEYYLATKADWVPERLQEIYDFLAWSQYTDLDQVNPKVKESHPGSYPKNAMASHGGWGHNPGFEGYGPICMLTGQGAMALALLERCGIDVDRERHEAAYAFLARGTGPNGYVWYGDDVGNPSGWADMGRTGTAGLANLLSPYRDSVYRERTLSHARVIGDHPESFPDTHGSPTMGMGYAAAAANADPKSFRRLMDANRWWFELAHCPDGSFYYQPNRDNAGYGSDSRMSATAVTAFVFSIPHRNLHITGKPFRK